MTPVELHICDNPPWREARSSLLSRCTKYPSSILRCQAMPTTCVRPLAPTSSPIHFTLLLRLALRSTGTRAASSLSCIVVRLFQAVQ
jgi:hypothetical protein